MKWIALLTVTAGVAYLFTSKKGKQLRAALKDLALELTEFKHYLHNIGGAFKQQRLKYGESPEPVASRH